MVAMVAQAKPLTKVLEENVEEWVELELLDGVDEAENFGNQVKRESRPSSLELKLLRENDIAKARYSDRTK